MSILQGRLFRLRKEALRLVQIPQMLKTQSDVIDCRQLVEVGIVQSIIAAGRGLEITLVQKQRGSSQY